MGCDDIDICMLHPDYERFLRESIEKRPDAHRVLHASIDLDFPYEFAKIHDLRTKIVEGTDYAYEIGINIDLFVLDSLPEGEKTARRLIRKMDLAKKLFKVQFIVLYGKKHSTFK